MIPEFFLLPEASSQLSLWKTMIGLIIIFIGTFVGIEISFGEDKEDL